MGRHGIGKGRNGVTMSVSCCGPRHTSDYRQCGEPWRDRGQRVYTLPPEALQTLRKWAESGWVPMRRLTTSRCRKRCCVAMCGGGRVCHRANPLCRWRLLPRGHRSPARIARSRLTTAPAPVRRAHRLDHRESPRQGSALRLVRITSRLRIRWISGARLLANVNSIRRGQFRKIPAPGARRSTP